MENITAYKVRGFLYQEGIITGTEMNQIKSRPSTYEQNEALLGMLLSKDNRSWVKLFFEFLEVHHKGLYDRLLPSDTYIKEVGT